MFIYIARCIIFFLPIVNTHTHTNSNPCPLTIKTITNDQFLIISVERCFTTIQITYLNITPRCCFHNNYYDQFLIFENAKMGYCFSLMMLSERGHEVDPTFQILIRALPSLSFFFLFTSFI